MRIFHTEFNRIYPENTSVELDPVHLFAIVVKSKGAVELDGKRYVIKPNTMAIFSENCEKVLCAADCDLIFDGFEFDAKPKDLLGIACNELFFGYDTYPLSNIIYSMKTESLDCADMMDNMLGLYATQFLIKMKRLCDNGIHTYPHRLDGLRNQIINMPYKQWTVDEMVNIAGMSKRQFYNSYLNAFGNSPRQEIINSRIEYAKLLLDSTEYRIAEVAAACNYKSVEHFSRIFKQKTGISPHHYRKRIDRKKYVNFIRKQYISPEDEPKE